MSEELIYQALYSALSLADSILQIWLTVTFAVIVATHLAADRIGQFMYFLVSSLYGLATLVLITRFVSAAYQIYRYRDLLVINGFEPWPVPGPLTRIIGGGTLLLLVGGSAATLWFVYSVRKKAQHGDA
jgi:hypothetical protein